MIFLSFTFLRENSKYFLRINFQHNYCNNIFSEQRTSTVILTWLKVKYLVSIQLLLLSCVRKRIFGKYFCETKICKVLWKTLIFISIQLVTDSFSLLLPCMKLLWRKKFKVLRINANLQITNEMSHWKTGHLPLLVTQSAVWQKKCHFSQFFKLTL